MKPLEHQIARAGITIALGLAFAVMAFNYQWFGLFDSRVYDLGSTVRPRLEAESNLVVVAIDQYARERVFSPPVFPICRHVGEHGRVIENLANAGAKIIVIDLLFDQLSGETDTDQFLKSLDDAGNVVLVSVIEKRSLESVDGEVSLIQEKLVLPAPAIPPGLYRTALVNMPVDPDRVVRRSYYGRAIHDEWLKTVPAHIAESCRTAEPGQTPESSRIAVPTGKGASAAAREPDAFLIDFSSPRSGFPVLSYYDILEGSGWEEMVAGRVVLIGVTENSLSDVYRTPVPDLPASVEGKLPGVFILAYASQTLLDDRTIAELPSPYALLLAALLVVCTALLILSGRIAVRAGLVLALLVAVLGCGIAMPALMVTVLPTGELMMAVIFTAVTGSLVSYIHTRVLAVEQKRELDEISSDLHTARAIQQKLQPAEMPTVDGYEIGGLQIPCKEIGGDYYDVIRLADGKLGLLVADVSGKGISGALLMSNIQSAVHSLAPGAASPSGLIRKLNSVVSQVSTEGKFVTLFYGALDPGRKELVYSNGGHLPAILYRKNGDVTLLADGGLLLGPFENSDWDESRVTLESGDILFIYTDGITEAVDRKTGDLFGEGRLIDLIKRNRGLAPEDLNADVVAAIRAFSRDFHLDDDATMLSVKVL